MENSSSKNAGAWAIFMREVPFESIGKGSYITPEVIEKDYAVKTGEFTDPGYVEALKLFQALLPVMNESPNALGHQQARDNWLAGKS